MKKWIALLLALTMVFSLAACGGGDTAQDPQDDVTAGGQQNNNEKPTETKPTEGDKKPVYTEDWGVEDRVVARNGDAVRAYLHLPDSTGLQQGTGLYAAQKDGSLVIIDGQGEEDQADNKIDEMFPHYFVNVESILHAYYQTHAKNYSFTITGTENVTINDYDMCVYRGSLSVELYNEQRTLNWVAYATKLKANDAFVYWVVFDYTDDQSMGETIEDHAYLMAHSIREK